MVFQSSAEIQILIFCFSFRFPSLLSTFANKYHKWWNVPPHLNFHFCLLVNCSLRICPLNVHFFCPPHTLEWIDFNPSMNPCALVRFSSASLFFKLKKGFSQFGVKTQQHLQDDLDCESDLISASDLTSVKTTCRRDWSQKNVAAHWWADDGRSPGALKPGSCKLHPSLSVRTWTCFTRFVGFKVNRRRSKPGLDPKPGG